MKIPNIPGGCGDGRSTQACWNPMKDYIAKFSFQSSVLSRPEAHQTTTFIEANAVSDAPVTIPPP